MACRCRKAWPHSQTIASPANRFGSQFHQKLNRLRFCPSDMRVLPTKRMAQRGTLAVVLFAGAVLHAAASPLEALQQGRADEAIAALQARIQATGNDAEAHNLLCRVYYAEERWEQAVS